MTINTFQNRHVMGQCIFQSILHPISQFGQAWGDFRLNGSSSSVAFDQQLGTTISSTKILFTSDIYEDREKYPDSDQSFY